MLKLSKFFLLLPIILFLGIDKCPPIPVPTPTPTIEPTPTPTPTPSPTIEPTPTPTPITQCPGDPMPMGKRVMFFRVIRVHPKTHKPGVIDSTPRINDEGYCGRVTNEPVTVYNCKANPEGSGYDSCDREFLSQNCPSWFYSTDKINWKICKSDPHSGPITCDHFDGWNEQQPYKGKCEVDNVGSPITGFIMTAHGPDGAPLVKGWVRSCDKTASVCTDPVEIDF